MISNNQQINKNTKLKKGLALVQFINNKNEIIRMKNNGYNIKSIYEKLFKDDKISMSYGAFYYIITAKRKYANKILNSNDVNIIDENNLPNNIDKNSNKIDKNVYSKQNNINDQANNNLSSQNIIDNSDSALLLHQQNTKLMQEKFAEIEARNKQFYSTGGMTSEELVEARKKVFGEK
jgi:hypothetical protein